MEDELDMAKLGRDLAMVKEKLGHGNFLDWIKAEFDMTVRTAQKFMRVYQTFGSKSANGCGFAAQSAGPAADSGGGGGDRAFAATGAASTGRERWWVDRHRRRRARRSVPLLHPPR